MSLRYVSILMLLLSSSAFANCQQFEQEAEAFSGVVPRLDESGKISAYLMYGEATFLAPKRSLITNARRQAEMSAKQAFTEFLESNFSSETIAQQMVNQIELTDDVGNTAGLAEEISSSLNTMQSNASATLSGIVKLDECVDVDGKYVMVALGWKPSMTTASQTASATMSGRQTGNVAASSPSSAGQVDAQTAGQTSQRVGSVQIITVTTQGAGPDLRVATNEALRMAVSQIYGEAFASQSVSIDTVAQLEVTDSEGQSAGIAAEQSVTQQAVSSSTSGIIRSWRYLEQSETSTGFNVSLEVSIPQYESLADPNKLKVIVAAPALNPNLDRHAEGLSEFVDAVRRKLEQSISQTRKLRVLERQHTGQIASELSRIGQSANTLEMAKLGQQAGADLIVIPVIERFSSRRDVREIGETTIERTIFDVEVSVKVAEVATSSLLATRSFPLNNRRVQPNNAIQMVVNLVMQPINGFIGGDIGGGFTPGALVESVAQPDVAALAKDAKKKLDEVKKNAETDW